VPIPRIFHSLWLGTAPFPEEFARYQQTWRDHHPDWELRFWTEDDLPDGLRRPEVYEKLRPPWVRTDILRLEVVWRFGGVHIDTDFECVRSIEPLLDGVDFFTAWMEQGKRVNNAIMGAVPGHPIVDRALDEIRPTDHFVPWDKETTGPLFFDRVLRQFPDATIFPKAYFFGATPEELREAYAVHHDANAWKDAAVYRSEIAKLERRLDKAKAETQRWRERAERAEAALTGESPLRRLVRRGWARG
jgi:mannosyltransferase OCH1-like enzyme